MIAVAIFGVLFFLYFFLFGLELLGSGAKVMSGCKAGELFGSDTNPIAGLMVGILATVLLQSSSTTTSIIVSLVGNGITIDQGIYMVMGANIGTSVTNTIVAMVSSKSVARLTSMILEVVVISELTLCCVLNRETWQTVMSSNAPSQERQFTMSSTS